MARCVPSPFPKSVLAEASRIAPNRRTSSDGICGDAAHRASKSDHNPDWRGVPHAFDVSHDPARFDANSYARQIAHRIAAGTETRVTYMVANFGGYDQIYDYAAHGDRWVQNGAPKRDHAAPSAHVHVSFRHDSAVENSTAPFFIVEEVVTEAEMDAIADKVVARLGRQKDGSPGVIGDEVIHVLGGYVDGKYKDGAIITESRKKYGLSS